MGAVRAKAIRRDAKLVRSRPFAVHWCQSHDQPETIYRRDWDEALASGWVTPAHIAVRVRGIVQHHYGVHDGDPVA